MQLLDKHAKIDTVEQPISFIEVRCPHTQKLLCKYNPDKQLIQIRDRNVISIIDLRMYHKKAS